MTGRRTAGERSETANATPNTIPYIALCGLCVGLREMLAVAASTRHVWSAQGARAGYVLLMERRDWTKMLRILVLDESGQRTSAGAAGIA